MIFTRPPKIVLKNLGQTLYTRRVRVYHCRISQTTKGKIMTNGWISAQRKIANRANGGFVPSAATLDKIAEKTISAGWNTSRSNICSNCFTTRPVNGSCCDD